jgi:uncharacterized membrane protein|tara:strand:+ start:24 stop:422 length:399 start_codon:yes stop_codon:yes gene_type:complete
MTSKIIINLIITAILFVSIDSIYLKLISPLFNSLIYNIQGSSIRMRLDGAIIAYLCIIGVFNYFILYKGANIIEAFALGLFIYGIYEGTNRALFSKWTTSVMIIDTLWGGILFSLVFILFKIINQNLLKNKN